MFRRGSARAASVPRSGTHRSGSVIDLSLMHRYDPARELDRGAPHLAMSALTPMTSPFATQRAQRNGRDITASMASHGLAATHGRSGTTPAAAPTTGYCAATAARLSMASLTALSLQRASQARDEIHAKQPLVTVMGSPVPWPQSA